MEESKGKRQKMGSNSRKDLVPELSQRNGREYSENNDSIKGKPINDKEEVQSIGLSEYKPRLITSLGNELIEQLENVQGKVILLLSDNENVRKESKEENCGLKDEIIKLKSELKYKDEQMNSMSEIARVAAEKIGKLSIEVEMKAKQCDELNYKLKSCITKTSQLKTQYNCFLKVFDQKSLQIMNNLKQNQFQINQHDLDRKSFTAIILTKEEELQHMMSKTEQLKTDNCANLTMVSKLNSTVQMLEVENHDLKIKIKEEILNSVEAGELLKMEVQADELIKKLNLQVNHPINVIELKERQVDNQKSKEEKLDYDLQKLKESKEEELNTKDNNHRRAFKKDIWQFQQEKDLLNKKFKEQAGNLLIMTNEKEKSKLYIAEQSDIIKLLKLDLQKVKESKEEELNTKDENLREALQKTEKDILQLQQEKDLVNLKVHKQAEMLHMMSNEIKNNKLYVTEQFDRIKLCETLKAETHKLNLKTRELNEKIELKEADLTFLNLQVKTLEQQNEELNARLKNTKSGKFEESSSKTEQFNEIASLTDPEIPTTKTSRKVEEYTKKSDDFNYPLVGSSNSSVYAGELIEKEREQKNKNYIEEAGDIVEAIMKKEIAAPAQSLSRRKERDSDREGFEGNNEMKDKYRNERIDRDMAIRGDRDRMGEKIIRGKKNRDTDRERERKRERYHRREREREDWKERDRDNARRGESMRRGRDERSRE